MFRFSLNWGQVAGNFPLQLLVRAMLVKSDAMARSPNQKEVYIHAFPFSSAFTPWLPLELQNVTRNSFDFNQLLSKPIN